MSKYRKKPIEVEAWRFRGEDRYEWPEWLAAHPDTAVEYLQIGLPLPALRITIGTLEGRMIAGRGDWIIKGVRGELYPCKPDIFDVTYEAVSP